MMDADPAFLSVSEAAAGIAARSLSAGDLVEACLTRIATYDGSVHSFLHCDPDAARSAAAHADREIALNGPRGPLHGMPVAVKDVIATVDQPTTYGSRAFTSVSAGADAECVRRLRAAGAIVIGKVAAWECGVGGTNFTAPWPPVRNPWRLDRDPGGSSTGAGAAVAAGFCFAALGTDTGGSIREPAAWCGVAGLKPTYGLVPCTGAMPASYSLDHVGPIARGSADCAQVLAALASSGTVKGAGESLRGLANLRAGYVALSAEERLLLDDAVAGAVEDASLRLSRIGAVLSSVTLPPLALFSAVVAVIAAVEGYDFHRERLAAYGDLYEPLTRQRLLAGAEIAAADYVAATRVRDMLCRKVAAIFVDLDVLLMPVSCSVAPTLGAFDSHGGHPSMTRPWNVTGRPALALPLGFDADGLPLAVQLVGRPAEDGTLLRIGHTLEQFEHAGRRPTFRAESASPAGTVLSESEVGDRLRATMREAVERVRAVASGAARPAHRFRPVPPLQA